MAGVLLEPSEQLRKPCEEWCYDVQQLVGGHHLLSVQVDTTEKVVVNVLRTQGFSYLNDTENLIILVYVRNWNNTLIRSWISLEILVIQAVVINICVQSLKGNLAQGNKRN